MPDLTLPPAPVCRCGCQRWHFAGGLPRCSCCGLPVQNLTADPDQDAQVDGSCEGCSQ